MKYLHKIGKTYDFGYTIEGLPLDKPVYGLAYDINNETKTRKLSCLPTLGCITKNTISSKYSTYVFNPYKNGTHVKRKSGIVDFTSRYYADTYEEAIEMYNELIQKRIDNLYKMIESAQDEKIK